MVILQPGNATGIGAVIRYTWKGVLPYRLTFDAHTIYVEPPVTLEAHATGELDGIGRWELATEGELTRVRYDWNVSTTKAWMNWLAPIAKPLFAWNHDVLMAQGGDGLTRLLNTHLVD